MPGETLECRSHSKFVSSSPVTLEQVQGDSELSVRAKSRTVYYPEPRLRSV
jgi:hypothetical protein